MTNETGRQHDQQMLDLINENVICPELDYLLLEDITNFDWDKFFSTLFWDQWNHGHGMLCESFENVSSDNKRSVYKIVTTNKSIFTFNVNYVDPKALEYKLMMLFQQYRNEQKILFDLQNTLIKTIEPVIHIVFEDEQKNMNITGKVGNYTLSLMSGIKESLTWEFGHKGYIPDILIFQIKKGEEKKRLPLYQKFFNRMILSKLNKIFVDNQQKDDIEVYIWKSI